MVGQNFVKLMETLKKITVDSLNEKQNKYYIASQLDVESKNNIYIGLLRQYPNSSESKNCEPKKRPIADLSDIKENINENSFDNSNDNNGSVNAPKIVSLEEIDDFFDVKKCYALKLLPYFSQKNIDSLDKERNIQDLFSEADPIIKYRDFVEIENENMSHILVAMDLHINFDLYFYMTRPTFSYDEKFICIVSYQCLKALQKLKERRIIHNDIKFENFIVVSEEPFEISLTDFEFAEVVEDEDDEMSTQFNGTVVFESPEVLRRDPHDYSADMWSLGMNIYFSLFDCYPFEIEDDDEDEKIILDKINKNSLIKNDPAVSRDAWSCIEKMLRKNPSERITPDDALKLKWFEFIELTEVKVKTDEFDVKPPISETTNS